MKDSQSTIRFLAIVAIAVVLGGCAFGQTVRYSEASVHLRLHGDKTVVVIVHDQRPDVVAGDAPSNWVGESRSLYGIPYDVTTENEEPLAGNMSQTIADALSARGFHATPLNVRPYVGKEAIIHRAVGQGVQRIVLLTLNKYASDTYWSTSVDFDVVLTVLDGSGTVMGTKAWSGGHNLSREDTDDVSPSQFFAMMIETWFSAPSIVRALEGAAPSKQSTSI